MKHAYRAEVIRTANLRVEKEIARAEVEVLKDENRSLQEAVRALNARMDEFFEFGYFTACYEAVRGLPADLDLHSILGWDREVIRAKAAQFQDANSGQEGPSRSGYVADPLPSQDSTLPAASLARASEETPDLPAASGVQRQDPGQVTEAIQLEEENVPRVPEVVNTGVDRCPCLCRGR